MLLTLSGRGFVKIQYSSFPLFPVAYPFRIATQLQFYVKREKCKVNDVIFPSVCEARAINLGNKNMRIGIFTGGTSVRSKNIFTDISPYPTGKHEIRLYSLLAVFRNVLLDSFIGVLHRFQTLFQSYHTESSHYSCLSWVSPELGYGSEVFCSRTFPRKTKRIQCDSNTDIFFCMPKYRSLSSLYC